MPQAAAAYERRALADRFMNRPSSVSTVTSTIAVERVEQLVGARMTFPRRQPRVTHHSRVN